MTFSARIGNTYTAPQWARDAAIFRDAVQRERGLDSDAARVLATDYFRNPAARMGYGTNSLAEGAEYELVRFSYNYWGLITLYRNHWISRRIVDCPAQDMVRAWPKLTSDMPPEDLDRVDRAIRNTQTKQRMLQALKWSRLFGGAGALIVIDGHEDHLDDPLDLEDIEPGSYRGLIPFDRWTGITNSTNLCTDIRRPVQFGLPEHYQVQHQGSAAMQVHASRILRFSGLGVPTPEYEAQQYWGISVLEPAYEEIRKRDNMSWNILMLTFRAQILGMRYPELAQILSGLGMNQQAAQQWYSRMQSINDMMSNQSMVLLPKDGELTSVNYTFTGLSDCYQQFQLDIAGAADLPVTRLFGRTITGLGQSNEADEKMYEERIAQEQDVTLRPNHDILYRVICRSELGEDPKDLNLQYPSIRVMDDKEKAELANTTTTAIIAAFNSGLINRKQALSEIQQSSAVTGFGTNITNEDIEAAEKEDAMLPEMAEPEGQQERPAEIEFSPVEHQRQMVSARDALPLQRSWMDLPITVECKVGTYRTIRNADRKVVYHRLLPCGYGEIRGTAGRDNACIDVLIGPVRNSDQIFVVDMEDLGPDVSAREDEDKVLVGFAGPKTACKAFNALYGEGWIRDWKAYSTDEFFEKYLKPRITDEAEFKESDHPRDEKSGKFTEGSGGSRGRQSALTPAPQDRAQWPAHIQKLKVPPAWTDVKINPNVDGDLLVVGKDAKGRAQYVYSDRFRESQSAIKFARIRELDAQYDLIQGQINEAVSSRDAWVRENASCARLVLLMGIRPGSDTDTKAKVKAYGATTLEGRHVVKEGDTVFLRFVGKKGVSLKLPVEDEALKKDLLKRAKKAGETGKLFSVDDTSLLDYVHTLDGGSFKTKDMRTCLATRTAFALVKTSPVPKSEKEYQKRVKEVATRVSAKLGNTPAVALQSYIAPEVFAEWRSAL